MVDIRILICLAIGTAAIAACLPSLFPLALAGSIGFWLWVRGFHNAGVIIMLVLLSVLSISAIFKN